MLLVLKLYFNVYQVVVMLISLALTRLLPAVHTLGSSGFPSGGNPYNQIKMNTNAQAYGTNPNKFYITSVLQHEMGHCIGFRHTDL